MLNKKVSASLQFDQLPDDTCRLLATWTISHLDVNGVFFADPAVVRSMVFTRRTDVTLEHIDEYLQAMESVGLIVRFFEDGQSWQYWPEFRQNQPGLRPERESADYPLPPNGNPAQIPRDDGEMSASGGQDVAEMPAEVKLREGKLSEVKHGADAQLPPHQENFTALAEVCAWDLSTITKKQRGALNQAEGVLRQGGACAVDIQAFSDWWFVNDWRGLKGDWPRPDQVRSEWGKFKKWRDSDGRNPARARATGPPQGRAQTTNGGRGADAAGGPDREIQPGLTAGDLEEWAERQRQGPPARDGPVSPT